MSPMPEIDECTALPLEQWLTYRFGLISARVGQHFAPLYMTRHGLKTWEWRALAVIGRYQPLSAKALAEHSSTNPIQVARAIESLRLKRLITRTPDPADRRRVCLRLTAKGRRVHDQIAQAACDVERMLISTLGVRERRAFESALCKIQQGVAQFVRAPLPDATEGSSLSPRRSSRPEREPARPPHPSGRRSAPRRDPRRESAA